MCVHSMHENTLGGKKTIQRNFFLCFLLKHVRVGREGRDKGMNYVSKGFCMWKMYGNDK